MMSGGGGMVLWWVLSIVVVIAVVVAIVFLVRALGGSQDAPRGQGTVTSGGESPRDVAKRRYASGEIDREQYEQLMKDL
jgi:putative membrane protein